VRRYDGSVESTSHEDQIRTVFLDRDGVINQKMPEGRYVGTIRDFRILPGAAEAIGRLNRAGVRVIVVSNQRGIALGLYTAEDVAAIQTFLQRALAEHTAQIDRFFFCPHDRKACDCRKPRTGLYEQAVHDFPEITPATSVMIGDSLSDIEFGCRAGMRAIFIEGDPETRGPGAESAMRLAEFSAPSLSAAVDVLFRRNLIPQ